MRLIGESNTSSKPMGVLNEEHLWERMRELQSSGIKVAYGGIGHRGKWQAEIDFRNSNDSYVSAKGEGRDRLTAMVKVIQEAERLA